MKIVNFALLAGVVCRVGVMMTTGEKVIIGHYSAVCMAFNVGVAVGAYTGL